MPRLIAPPADSRVLYSVLFEWTPVTLARAYGLQVSDDEGFTAPLLVDETVAAPEAQKDLLVSTPLWWRVRALDLWGRPGPWSLVRRLNIVPPAIADSVFAVTLTPSSMAGGELAQGLITLTDPAPDGGATVLLSGSEPGRATFPPRVLFASGARTATFPITTRPVAADTEVRISAASRNNTQTATLALEAPRRAHARLTSFTVNPAVLAPGSRAIGSVILASPALSRTTVQLATADAARVSVPATVSIPAGGSSANFAVLAAPGTTPATVTVSAALDDVTRTAAVRVGAGTVAGALPAPSPLLPNPDALIRYDGTIEFEWSEVTWAVSYTIEVDEDSNFTAPAVASRTVPFTRLNITPLPAGDLWWRVRANDVYGTPGRWSPPRLLRVRAR